MLYVPFNEIVTKELKAGAILNEEFEGFREDYLVLHCLLRLHEPKRFLEIGTNMGTGTNIITNAIPKSTVYSLDLPQELAHASLQNKTGSNCKLPYIQLIGNSLSYDYQSLYPLDGWWIDGEHEYLNVLHESEQASKAGSKLIIWHDTNIPGVMKGLSAIYEYHSQYNLYRVTGSRVSYALRK